MPENYSEIIKKVAFLSSLGSGKKNAQHLVNTLLIFTAVDDTLKETPIAVLIMAYLCVRRPMIPKQFYLSRNTVLWLHHYK
ncbi:MAG: hypothetical protein CL867_04910 [Cytophagaceae bacterium]|jgi:hypothetical protein|nr:hypothetical protein [Cytophagaceae bacterium]|tara:strand:- start:537 stop:779 length:243 start_codon:yes stop_codon:yes gene_type:complete